MLCAAAEEAEAQSKGGLEDLSVFRESDVHSAIADPQNLVEALAGGVGRFREKSTWKVWQWPAGGQEFNDAESFRWDIGRTELILGELANFDFASSNLVHQLFSLSECLMTHEGTLAFLPHLNM